MMNESEIVHTMKSLIAAEIHAAVEEVDEHATFQELGLDSINSMFLLDELDKKLGTTLEPVKLLDYPTISTFAKYVNTAISE